MTSSAQRPQSMEEALTVPKIGSLNTGNDDGAPRDSWNLPGIRYRVVGEIARGGMGLVLRAYDATFDRPLAIKVLLRGRGSPFGDDRRFLEEARITGQLQHPGIPPVHEIGRLDDGRPFFSMKQIGRASCRERR